MDEKWNKLPADKSLFPQPRHRIPIRNNVSNVDDQMKRNASLFLKRLGFDFRILGDDVLIMRNKKK